MASLEELRVERLRKIEQLEASGLEVYPIDSKQDYSIAQAFEAFDKLVNSGVSVCLLGRVRTIRSQGSLIFFDFDDGTGSLQGLLKKTNLTPESFSLFEEVVDVGDYVELEGKLFITKRGEKTIEVSSWRMLAKSLRPLPDKYHGLKDLDERFRHRYLDSLMAPEIKERFIFRSHLISAIRSYLDKSGYLEVETPILQPLPGGASAEPFVTHHQTLDLDLYLRISEELYLKRYLIGGFPRVYSLSRNFRNEGIDVTHNPEFTMLEFYASFASASDQRSFLEKMLKHLVKKLLGKSAIVHNGETINLGAKFKVVTYYDILKRYALVADPEHISQEDLTLKARQLAVSTEPGDSREKIMDAIYKKVCRPKIIQPTFLIDYLKNYLPLAKQKHSNSGLVDAFQLVIGGIELAKAFSELNDPREQLKRFEEQEKQRAVGDKEAQVMDLDFVEALEYGMPPAGGVGIGIDRLVMFLTNTHNIKEVIFFPTTKPR